MKKTKGFQIGNKAGIKTRFTSFNQPKNNGRKPLIGTKTLRKYGEPITKEDFKKSVAILLNLTYPELELIYKDGKGPDCKAPIWLIAVVSALLKSLKNGNAKLIIRFIDMIIGSSPKKDNINKMDIQYLTPEEQELLSYLLSK